MKKRILVAGGTSGIGRKVIEQLSSQEFELICACRSPEKLADHPDIETVLFDATAEELSCECPETLDGFVYCPGTINLKPFNRLNDEDFLHDFQVNALGAVRLLRHLLPALKKGTDPSVVLFSTVAVQTGLPFHASIAAAKGAVEGLVRSLAAELAPTVRVNGIAPSLTDTPLAENLLSTDDKREASAARHPLKRIGDPAELARMVLFLLGDDSRFASGQIFKIDGGLSAIKTL